MLIVACRNRLMELKKDKLITNERDKMTNVILHTNIKTCISMAANVVCNTFGSYMITEKFIILLYNYYINKLLII